MTKSSLSELELAVLEFERGWWLERGAEPKAQAVRRCLGIAPTTYRATLERLLDEPLAEQVDPLLVRRLRRRRDERRRLRFEPETPLRRQPR